MKYTKKMKLVEINDNNNSSYANTSKFIDDEVYSKPRNLSSLDDAMNEILRSPISDVEKLQLYSQALQKYLNHIKVTARNIEPSISYPKNNKERHLSVEDSFNCSLQPFEMNGRDSFINSIGNATRPQSLEMSGVQTIRDSLDSITQPIVRNFFENVRHRNAPASPSHLSPNISNTSEQVLQLPVNNETIPTSKIRLKKKNEQPHRVLPYRTVAGRKRQAEKTLSSDISSCRPCKVALQRLDWTTSNAR